MDLEATENDLVERITRLDSVLVGYSAGVDSTLVAALALETLGPSRVLAVTAISESVPAAQRQFARGLAEQLGLPHLEVQTDELRDPRYAANPTNRCYFCKTELWSRLTAIAHERGFAHVVDGANADDRSDHRPGTRAGREHGVRSPLAEAGIDKAGVRLLSRRRGLTTWDQPSSPCLASRLPYGLAVTAARLETVDRAEAAVRALGFREFRVRHHGDAARLEVHPSEMDLALNISARIARALHGAGFERALLDVEGYRSGSLNEGLSLVQLENR
jgi:pyridinium-3,5-biscarboxylic acid mononucleotide sulfurtransferase